MAAIMSSSSTTLDGSMPVQNARSRICNFPPEVLSAIFHASVPRRDSELVPWRRKLAHVCQYFRTVALSDPTLWSQLDLLFPQLVRWQLDFCAGVPLKIKVDVDSHQPESQAAFRPWKESIERRAPSIVDMWTFILEKHSPVIGSLEFRFGFRRDSISERTFFPALERDPLTFAFISHVDIHFTWTFDDVPFCDALFKHRFPALRYVRLTEAEANLNQPMFFNLDLLAIDGSSTRCPPLHALSHVVELSLTNLSTNFPNIRASFSLPYLRKLTVHGSHEEINGLFQYMTTPMLASAALVRYAHEHDAVRVYEPVIDRLFKPPHEDELSLTYIVRHCHQWAYQLEGTSKFLSVRTGLKLAPGTVRLSNHEHAVDGLIPLMNYLRPMLHSIVTLGIRSWKPSKYPVKQLVLDQFGALTNVKTLHLDHRPLRELIERWKLSPEYLPAVCALHLHGMYPSTSSRTHLQIPGIVGVLAARAKHAQGIQELALMNGSTMPWKVERGLQDLGIGIVMSEYVEERPW